MKVLLVTRGSQGDVYPYLSLAKGLQEAGHEVTIHLPFAFEKFVQTLGIPYTLQNDDVEARSADVKLHKLLSWIGEMIESQFNELVPLAEKHDVFVSSNTEFAAPSIAEYTKKPYVRTAYSPFVPGKKIYPPISPLVNPHLLLTPGLMWNLLNLITNSLAIKPVNKWRKAHGLGILKDNNEYAYSQSFNLMLYSALVGEVDTDWKYRWNIAGYCFNDKMLYEKSKLEKFIEFIRKDSRPTLFFTMGSMKDIARKDFAKKLYDICKKHSYKFVICSGWAKIGEELQTTGSDTTGEDLFLLDTVIPHNLVLEHCTALIHHGGSGTTHSAVRSLRPQMIVPIMVDQYYWGERTRALGLGPGTVSLKRIGRKKLEEKVLDLMTNQDYAKNAARLGEKIRAEDGVKSTVKFIEGLV